MTLLKVMRDFERTSTNLVVFLFLLCIRPMKIILSDIFGICQPYMPYVRRLLAFLALAPARAGIG